MDGIKSFSQLEPNHLVDELILFIESQLANFIRSDEFAQITAIKKNENQHTESFCIYMNNKCSARFCFMKESSQKGSSVIDIAVYRGAVLIFTIEAKLLPTPKGTIAKPRAEHEYVYGKGAGIQRFKEEQHGMDNQENLLPVNGMIGFLKEKDDAFWLAKINFWIDQAGWPSSERIIEIAIEKGKRYVSKHLRVSNKMVTLHHFWISVFNKD